MRIRTGYRERPTRLNTCDSLGCSFEIEHFELTEFSIFFIKQVIERAELLFSEVLNAISQIAEKGFRRCIGELEEVLQREKAEFEVINYVFI